MSKDYIGYEALMDSALRGVVHEALRRVERQALIGSHHFYLTFKTNFPGVDIPEFLHEQYPDEMTIVLQHQFWDLKVEQDQFKVTLTFRKLPAELVIPFAALTAFVDPGVQFGLQFKVADADATQTTASTTPTPGPQAPSTAPAEKPLEKPAAPGEVVSLDAFRKK
ncbi:MAG: SspB family protein [Rhizomicrobium sp.]